MEFVFLILVILAMLSIKANNNAKFRWTGRMICNRCGYQWLSRRKFAPGRCARCSSSAIEPLSGNIGVVRRADVDKVNQKLVAKKYADLVIHAATLSCPICGVTFSDGTLVGKYVDYRLPDRGFCKVECLREWERKCSYRI